MNASDVNAIVDNVFDKLGIVGGAVQPVYESLSRYIVAMNISSFIGFSICLAAMFVIGQYSLNRLSVDRDDCHPVFIVGLVLSVVIGFIMLFGALSSACNAIGCLAAPEAAAVEYLIKSLRCSC